MKWADLSRSRSEAAIILGDVRACPLLAACAAAIAVSAGKVVDRFMDELRLHLMRVTILTFHARMMAGHRREAKNGLIMQDTLLPDAGRTTSILRCDGRLRHFLFGRHPVRRGSCPMPRRLASNYSVLFLPARDICAAWPLVRGALTGPPLCRSARSRRVIGSVAGGRGAQTRGELWCRT